MNRIGKMKTKKTIITSELVDNKIWITIITNQITDLSISISCKQMSVDFLELLCKPRGVNLIRIRGWSLRRWAQQLLINLRRIVASPL